MMQCRLRVKEDGGDEKGDWRGEEEEGRGEGGVVRGGCGR